MHATVYVWSGWATVFAIYKYIHMYKGVNVRRRTRAEPHSPPHTHRILNFGNIDRNWRPRRRNARRPCALDGKWTKNVRCPAKSYVRVREDRGPKMYTYTYMWCALRKEKWHTLCVLSARGNKTTQHIGGRELYGVFFIFGLRHAINILCAMIAAGTLKKKKTTTKQKQDVWERERNKRARVNIISKEMFFFFVCECTRTQAAHCLCVDMCARHTTTTTTTLWNVWKPCARLP